MQQRTALMAVKEGMSRIYRKDDGVSVPVTVLNVSSCQVTGVRTQKDNGYSAVQIGIGTKKAKNCSKAERTNFANAKIEPKAKLIECRVSEDAMLDVGAELSAAHFVPGQYVDVTGITIGRGFAGVMKRHNFSGLRATHGVSVSHRSHGSTGCRQDPGRVFKNKKMAGHMGATRVTTLNLKVVDVDAERGLIYIKGCVPGVEKSFVIVRDAVKRERPKDAPFPAALKSATQSQGGE